MDANPSRLREKSEQSAVSSHFFFEAAFNFEGFTLRAFALEGFEAEGLVLFAFFGVAFAADRAAAAFVPGLALPATLPFWGSAAGFCPLF
jgi:hypothetical protein